MSGHRHHLVELKARKALISHKTNAYACVKVVPDVGFFSLCEMSSDGFNRAKLPLKSACFNGGNNSQPFDLLDKQVLELAEITLAVGIVAAIPVGILASSQCDADLLRLIILASTIGPVSGKVTLARSELPSVDVLLFREWERLFPSSSPTRPIRTSPLPGRRSWMFPPCEPSRAFPSIPAYDGRYYAYVDLDMDGLKFEVGIPN
jgi:hypothetical protein